MATSPIYGWLEPDNTDLVKNGALAIRTLGNAIDTTMATMTPKSLVDAKGDLVTATANDTPARLAVGADGSTLVANSASATGLAYALSPGFAAGKNKIINGDFGIWQRGTSFSNPASGSFSADRYSIVYDGTGATRTISQQTFTPGAAPVSGYESPFFHRYVQSVAGSSGSFQVLITKLEDVRTLAGQTATLSFWIKDSSARTLTVAIRQDFGSGGSSVVDTNLTSVVTTTGWARYSATVAIPSVSGKTIGTGSNLTIQLYLPVNTTFTIDHWGLQLEAGSVATPFQTATGTIQGELAACQRYLPAVSNIGGVNEFAVGYAYATNATIYVVNLPVPARVQPTGMTLTGSFNSYAFNTATAGNPIFFGASITTASIGASPTITAGQGSRIQFNGAGSVLFTGCEL